jgi:hypothetical protein
MKVYLAINRVQLALSKQGITKANRNQQQGYNFRGIDDVFNALSPLLAEHGLCILPRVISRTCDERINAKGTVLLYVTVEVEFDFVSAEDGSKHTIKTFGEAMDSGDKATNKAMSAAYKYAALQAFAIPTEGDNDADAHTHQVAPQQRPQPVADKPFDLPAALDWIKKGATTEQVKERGRKAYAKATNEEDRARIAALVEEIEQSAMAGA